MANSEAGTSSDAAPASGGEYQVFLSFRGPDTRNGFTDFLYHDLVDVGVRVFRDDDELRVGEKIYENLQSAINNSIIYIPIFSRTYASSKWCLWELAQIVDNESKSEGKKSILPIFVGVEPKDVKLKTRLYENALLEHKKHPDEVGAWRAALAAVGKIKGLNAKSGPAEIAKLVVERVLEKLQTKQETVTEHLLGLDDRVKHLTGLLDINHPNVRLIGIFGMGGIGKTTIAQVVFNQLFSHFGKCCSFLKNVRQSSSTEEGLVKLQKKLLSDISFGSEEKFNDSDKGMKRIGETLSNKKVLVILDDVDSQEHIKKLIGFSKLQSQSRIIITTRNISILEVDWFIGETLSYEMVKMDDDIALQLFCRHASPSPVDNYYQLSSEIVLCIGGLPLAITVIGSFLKGKGKEVWEETLSKVSEKKVRDTLMISYNDLEYEQQQICLDIACFFTNKKKTNAIYMWANCEFYPRRGIKVLTDRCLIKILDNDKF